MMDANDHDIFVLRMPFYLDVNTAANDIIAVLAHDCVTTCIVCLSERKGSFSEFCSKCMSDFCCCCCDVCDTRTREKDCIIRKDIHLARGTRVRKIILASRWG